MDDKLPVYATGDEEGITIYPETLWRVGGAAVLHIYRDYPCYAVYCDIDINRRQGNIVEYLGDRKHKVCVNCRKVLNAIYARNVEEEEELG